MDGAAHVDSGAGLAQDGPRPLGGCVVGEAGLDRGQGVGAGLAPPAEEVPGPPLHQVGVVDLRQHLGAESVVGQDAQSVEDGVLLSRVPALIGLVKGLHRLFEDGLHPRPPLVPEALGDAHDRIGGAVAVGEDAGVQQIDAGSSPLVGQVDEPHLLDEGLRDVLEQAAHQVGVGVHDHDGVAVPALGLLPHLVGDDVVHEGGLAHAGAGDVEVVASQQVVGEVNLPGRSGGGVADVGAAADAAGGGQQHLGPGAGHQWRLVPGSRRVPQAGRLADAQDAALAEESGA